MVKALARRCVELQFTLTANPDARPPVRATVASGVQMAVRGVLTAVHDRGAYDSVALSPSDAKWDAWWTEALRDWPKSKGRTYVLDDVARADMRHVISVPPALMTRFLLPFEIASVLLTAALIGAVVIALEDGEQRRGT
jgi:hypothetical protein